MSALKIAVSTWSLFRWFQMKKLNDLDFPKFCVDNFQINQLEYVEDHMRLPTDSKSTEDAYLDQLLKTVKAAKIDDTSGKIVCIAVRNDFTVPDASERQNYVEHVRGWIQRAARLEVPVIRIYIGRHPFEGETPGHVRECIEQILPDAKSAKVRLAIENRGSRAENPEDIARVDNDFDSDWLGVCFDLGSHDTNTLERYLSVLTPHTFHVHAKTYPTELDIPFPGADYPRCVMVLKRAGYAGYWSIEYEHFTTNLNEQVEGVRQTLELLQKLGG